LSGARRSGAILTTITSACLIALLLHGWRFASVFLTEMTVHLSSLVQIVVLLGYGLIYTVLVVADARSFGRPDRPTVTQLERIACWSGLIVILFLWGALA
jgi:hypothetical protein